MPTSTVQTFANGALTGTRNIDVSQEAVNRDALLGKARAALAANATFLALANPTAAQVAAQTKLLTRECNALIRLLLDAVTDVSDT